MFRFGYISIRPLYSYINFPVIMIDWLWYNKYVCCNVKQFIELLLSPILYTFLAIFLINPHFINPTAQFSYVFTAKSNVVVYRKRNIFNYKLLLGHKLRKMLIIYIYVWRHVNWKFHHVPARLEDHVDRKYMYTFECNLITLNIMSERKTCKQIEMF